jgi:hypothetical protein
MTHALPLLIALACASDPAAAPPDDAAVEVCELASLQPAAAVRVEGKRLRFRVRALDAVTFGVGKVAATYLLDSPRRVMATARMDDADLPLTADAEVEAELHVEYVPARFPKGGAPSPAGWVYRLETAAVVGP